MRIRSEALYRLAADLERDPALSRRLRAAPFQTLAMIPYLTSNERTLIPKLILTSNTSGAGAYGGPTLPPSLTGIIRHLGPAPPAPGLGEDPAIQWREPSVAGVLRPPLADYWNQTITDAWHAGRVADVVVTAAGDILVAAQYGGVWAVTEGADSPLTDWDSPDTAALAQGPHGPQHVYAGGTSLYETDVRAAFPLRSWREINLAARLLGGPSISGVHRIRVHDQFVFVASERGVFWSRIPPPGGSYLWRKAMFLPEGGYYGMAIGRGWPGTGNPTLAVTPMKNDAANSRYGIFLAEIDPNMTDLGFGRAGILEDIDPSTMGATSLASAPSDPSVMYAAMSINGSGADGWLQAFLVSRNGGVTWRRAAMRTLNGNSSTIGAPTGDTGGQGNDQPPNIPNNCLAVSSLDPTYVALGWRRGPFISYNGGDDWIEFGDDGLHWGIWTPHLHGDIHSVAFAPAESGAGRERLFVAGDGGLAMSPDGGRSWTSQFNRTLRNLQMYSPLGDMESFGSMDVSAEVPGLVVVGTQDEGLVAINLALGTPWSYVDDGGDGGHVRLLRVGGRNYVVYGMYRVPLQSIEITDSGSRALGASPARISYGGVSGDVAAIFMPAIEVVRRPQWTDSFGRTLLAIVGGPLQVGSEDPTGGGTIGGVYWSSERNQLEWRIIGNIALAQGDRIRALASFDGSQVIVGTQYGHIFDLVPDDSASVIENQVHPRFPGDNSRGVMRIALGPNGDAYATYSAAGSRNFVLRRYGRTWYDAAGGLPPNAILRGLDIDQSGNLYVCADEGVFISRNRGSSWRPASIGLPLRPHGADVRVVRDVFGSEYVYLSTTGRGLWIAST